MVPTTHAVSVNGRMRRLEAFRLNNGIIIIVDGRFLRVSEIFDEYWIQDGSLSDPHWIVQHLKSACRKPDLFTFAQRIPHTQPLYDFPMEWDNVAAVPVSSYDSWFGQQITSATRRNIRASEKRGIVVKVSDYNEAYVRGIVSIFNESPIRAGRRYWHYGKDFESVKSENGTYRERSTFLGAYFGGELVGYMKIVWDIRCAAIMQILSKLEHRDKRPNNALMAEAVKLCSEKKIEYLLYNQFVYGNKGEDSLTRFKKENGFVQIDLPRYYIPLTLKGSVALGLGLHHDPKALVPQWLRRQLTQLRDKWYCGQVRGT